MLKRFAVLTGMAGLLTLGVLASAADEPEEDNQLTLIVASADPEQEVDFECAFVISSDDQAYHSLKQKTPYVFRTTSLLLSGVFHCASADSRINLEIAVDGPTKRGMSAGSGTGTVIIVGRGMGENINDHIYVLR
ncbi:MAG: hypothetical protein ACE5GA_01675 [Candidatus Zixiibacteriota bacterium]